MKTIGMIGGMSWESTVTYYQLVNEEVKRRLGGLHSAKVILHSVPSNDKGKHACQRPKWALDRVLGFGGR